MYAWVKEPLIPMNVLYSEKFYDNLIKELHNFMRLQLLITQGVFHIC